ncbi:hypothetical protein GWK47_025675 [Chionoecetes opilio]|uniref:Helix-turn-helix domain-containing protein n=1 Tax=Chionoecetes opilio TaxID=41210 RepID=A0A8J8WDM5_CHIOP|nr:hypothetical protein GWK47_025675 [Chionoecetes opilio]
MADVQRLLNQENRVITEPRKKVTQVSWKLLSTCFLALPALTLSALAERLSAGEIILSLQEEESFITNVYVKPTNTGHCLNGEGECPQRYKDSTIGAYIRRALTHCSIWQLMHKEIERSTQVLINNGFSERDINRQTKKILENWYNPNATKESRHNYLLPGFLLHRSPGRRKNNITNRPP